MHAHELQVARLGELGAPSVLGTRPIVNDVGSRQKKAYLWTQASGLAAAVCSGAFCLSSNLSDPVVPERTASALVG